MTTSTSPSEPETGIFEPEPAVLQLLVNSFVIVALFTPLLWYLADLRRNFPGDASLLSVGAFNLIVIAALIVAPILALRSMHSGWCRLRFPPATE